MKIQYFSDQVTSNKKTIIFLCGLLPSHLLSEIEFNSIGATQSAADTQQKALAEGLFHFDKELILLNLMYVGSFPKRYRKIFIKYFDYSSETGLIIKNIGFFNLSIVKLLSRYRNTKTALLKTVNNESIVLIYAAHLPFVAAAVAAKRKFPGLKICLVVPDIPEFMSEKNVTRDFIMSMQTYLFKLLYKRIDGFLLVTKFIADYIGVKSKPYFVLDGLFREAPLRPLEVKESDFTILYSGTLAERYDIMNLIDAFTLIVDERFRLWIFGDGDCNSKISAAAAADSRISFFGQISRQAVLSYQKRASVLVNPRTGRLSYTKYSFPSKLLEYFASGTPVVLRKLEGVDDEYYKHCFVVENDSAQALAKCLLNVSKLSLHELQTVGEQARSFVLKSKNPIIQSERVLKFLYSI